MNVAPSTQLDATIKQSSAPAYRFHATLVSYDHVAHTAVVTSVASGPTSQQSAPLEVSRSLQVLDGTLIPGVLVVVEKVSGRRPMVVDTYNSAVESTTPAIRGDSLNLGQQITTDIVFRENDPDEGWVSWDTGYISYRGERFQVGGGQTNLTYIYWPEGSTLLNPSSDVPSLMNKDRLVLLNRGGVVSMMTNNLDGYALVSGSVAEHAIASGAVGSVALKDNSITSVKYQDLSVTSGKIADASITAVKIVDLNITTTKYADLSVVSGKIADANITTPKIADLNVTTAKYADLSVVSGKIADGNITTVKYADLSVVSGKIADGTISTPKYADLSIVSGKIADANITTPKYAELSIVSGKLANNSVTDRTIPTAEIADSKVNWRTDVSAGSLASLYVIINIGGTDYKIQLRNNA